MPRSDDVPAESQTDDVCLGAGRWNPSAGADKAVDKGNGVLNAHVFHVYLTSINVIVSWGPQ